MKHSKIIGATLITAGMVNLALLGLPPVQAQTQAQMNETAAKGEAKADTAMNAAYKNLLAVLSPPQKAQLKRAQQAWLVFRDSEAALLSSDSEGGTMHPAVYASEAEAITQERTRELKRARRLLTEK